MLTSIRSSHRCSSRQFTLVLHRTATRTLATMDGAKTNKAEAEAAPKAEAKEPPVDPKEVLNNPHLLAGSQALHKAYNKYNIKATQPSSSVPRVDHGGASGGSGGNETVVKDKKD